LQRLFDDFVVRELGFVTDQFPIADAEAKVARAAVVLSKQHRCVLQTWMSAAASLAQMPGHLL
jgi:hypothetical protein